MAEPRLAVAQQHCLDEPLSRLGGIVLGRGGDTASAAAPGGCGSRAERGAVSRGATAEEPAPQHTEAEPPVPLAPRQPRPVDPLASDQPARETAPRAAREPRPPGAAAEAVFTPAAEHNSTEAAQRLIEAVLRSHRKP